MEIFVLHTELWIPPFNWNMHQGSCMFVAREISEKPSEKLFMTHIGGYHTEQAQVAKS